MILISDSHVSTANENVEPFFRMLEQLENYEDMIVFMGDIFDLWISLPGYEEDIQKRFIQWCERRNGAHGVGFVEGNHEFFVVRRHGDVFRWSTEARHQEGSLLFVHGDLINTDDKNYLRFRKITKNAFTRTLVRFLPFGSKLVQRLKKALKHTNKEYRIRLPEEHLARYAEEQFARGVTRIMVGHFHQEFLHKDQSGRYLQVLPDWFATQKICRFDGDRVTTLHWSELSSQG